MNRVLFVITFILLSSKLSAQENNTKFFSPTQICIPFDLAIATAAEYGEQLLFTGVGAQFYQGIPINGGMFFFVNQETGTWSLVNVYGDGYACLINAGSEFAPYTSSR
jgi:hypothetical protein